MDELFAREISRAGRQNIPVAVALLTLDHHRGAGGDRPKDDAETELAAQLLLDAVRSSDVVARYDDQTFAVIMPNIYSMMVPGIGEKIMRAFRQGTRLTTAEGVRTVTLSAGFAVAFPRRDASLTASALFDEAGATLRAARDAGGDRFEIAGIPSSLLPSLALGCA
jgi:diguanylate cyclase (GGDEF)-like protein